MDALVQTDGLPFPFSPFRCDEAVSITWHRLPHWHQAGCTYFVTFRLADALPLTFLKRWQRERQEWLRDHGVDFDPAGQWHEQLEQLERLSSEEQEQYYRLFPTAIEDKLDEGCGSCLLRDEANRRIVEQTLQHFHEQRYWLGSYVIMPTHVHVLLTPWVDSELPALLYSWKSFSAKAINRLRNAKGAIWQAESFDHIVRNGHHLDRFRQYIQLNPVRARLSGGYTLCASQ